MESELLVPNRVPVEDISSECLYGMRFDYNDPLLEISLDRRGMLSPILLKQGGEKATLVSGHKRFFHARKKKWEAIPAHFIQERFSEKEFFFLSLYSNWNQNFSDLDRMVVLQKAGKVFHLTHEELLRDVSPALGLLSERGILEDYERVGELKHEIHLLIQQKKIPFRGASALNHFSEEEQLDLAERVFCRVNLTTNQLLRFVEWFLDLKKLKKASLEELIEKTSIRQVLRDPRLNSRMRGEKLFALTRALRFPRLSEEEGRFARSTRWLKENKEISLGRPEGFETSGVLLRAHLKNRSALTKVIRFLQTHRSSLESLL